MQPRDLVDTETAGAAVGRSPRTIRQWIAEERLCAYGTPARREVSLAEVLELGELLGAGDPYNLLP